jgi:transposase-like protein
MAKKHGPSKGQKYRQYSDDDRGSALATLAMNGGNIAKTSKDLAIPQATLRKWRDGSGISTSTIEKCDIKKEVLGDIFEQVVRVYLRQALSPGVVAKASSRDAIMTAAVAADKMQLLRAKPVASPNQPAMTHEQRIARLRELAALANSRRLAFEAIANGTAAPAGGIEPLATSAPVGN